MRLLHGLSSIAVSVVLSSAYANAADCSLDKKAKDLNLHEINTYYQCVRTQLVNDYQRGDNDIAKAYSHWKPAATGPAKPGFHSNRYLMTYVNDIGHSTYTAYASTNVNMPVGSIIAKESFKIKSKGLLSAGPLFFMEKVGVDIAPKTSGWRYSAVKKNGTPMKVGQTFCHSCHQAYSAQDSLGYPVVDVRLK